MEKIKTFIGHSFSGDDEIVVNKFLDFFNHLKDLQIPFEWDHAEKAEPEELSKKVFQKMNDKNTFIGICTRKEAIITTLDIKPSFWNPKIFRLKESDFTYKTSDWIIQEIGCAIGREMKVILLLEKGIRKPGALQGNLEYIEFDRNYPEKIFTKITEMLNHLLPPSIVTESIPTSDQSDKPKIDDKIDEINKRAEINQDTTIEISESWSKDEFDHALFRAILSKNKDKENQIITKYKQIFCTDDKVSETIFIARSHYYNNLINKEDNFAKMKCLVEQEPKNPTILYYYGELFQLCGEYNQAVKFFVEASTNSSIPKDKMNYLSQAIICLVDNGSEEYVNLLEELKNICVFENHNDILLDILIKIGKKTKNDFIFTIASEAILNGNPLEQNYRFYLAYRYAEIGQKELSYLHYLFLATQYNSPAYWNNLGVTASSFNLNAKAIQSFRKSSELGNTLSMSNIAYDYISKGFILEAEELCNKAIQIKDYDKNVAGAISAIKAKIDYEKEEEDKILEKAKSIKKILLMFSDAFIKTQLESLPKNWKHPQCQLLIEITNGSFKAIGFYQKKDFNLSLLINPSLNLNPTSSSNAPKENFSIYNILIEGSIKGYMIEANYYEYKAINSQEDIKKDKKELIMIVNDNKNKISAYVKNEYKLFFELILD